MEHDTTIVSGSDSNYYPLLKEWLDSVKRCPQSAQVDICILDAGLSESQRRELAPLVTKIVSPPWPSPAIERKAAGKEHLKACICRPFLPRMFPGYKTYLWMDCDTWVQDWDGVRMFLEEAVRKPDRLIATSGSDRSYPRSLRTKWLWHLPYSIRNFYFTNARPVFGFRAARKLLTCPSLYAGCFAMDGNAPQWNRWQELATIAGEKGKVFTAEQLTLGYLIYVEEYKVALLPAYAHWIAGHKPLWDLQRRVFVEPNPPHSLIGIVHLAGVDAMRANRRETTPYETTDGGQILLNCRYPHLDGGEVNGTPERS